MCKCKDRVEYQGEEHTAFPSIIKKLLNKFKCLDINFCEKTMDLNVCKQNKKKKIEIVRENGKRFNLTRVIPTNIHCYYYHLDTSQLYE